LIWFQQGGIAPHYGREIRNYLKFVIIKTQFSLTDGLAEKAGLSDHHDRRSYRHSITFYEII